MALTERYVSTTGGGAHDGTTASDAFSFAEMVTDINAGSKAGYRYNVISGTEYDLSAGAVTISGAGPFIIQGYTSTIGDKGRATLSNGTATTDMLTFSGGQAILRDLIFKSTATTGNSDGVKFSTTATSNIVERCLSHGWRDNGFEAVAVPATFIDCEAYDCNKSNTALKGGFVSSTGETSFIRCVSHHHTGGTNSAGFIASGSGHASHVYIDSVASNNSGRGFFIGTRSGCSTFYHCDSYSNTVGFDFDITSYIPLGYLIDCTAIDNSSYAVRTVQATSIVIIENTYSKGTRLSDAGKISDESSSNTFSSVPYTDTTGNFTLDATNGLSGRSNSFTLPQSLGYSTTTTMYRDVGASRHQDPAGGGLITHAGMTGGMNG